jgi:Xaa-Pro dipeptidase
LSRDGKAIARQICTQMEKNQLDALLLTNPGSIVYATGYKVLGSGNLAVIAKDGTVTLICSEFIKNSVLDVVDPEVVNVVAYPCWIFIEDYAVAGEVKEVQPDPYKVFKIASDYIPKANGTKVGIEPQDLNYSQHLFLAKIYGEENLIDCRSTLVEACVIKTPWEIEILRANAKACQIAMHKTAHATLPGTTMADIFDMFSIYSLEALPGSTVINHAHTIANKFAPTMMPGGFEVQPGDLVRLDGGPNRSGYNSDLGRTYAVGGECGDDKKEIYEALWNGHQYQLENIKPGVRMCDIFEGTDKAIKESKCMVDYGYNRGHYGHSLGCLANIEEYPFIAPTETRVFEPGMVFCIETPYYSSRHHTYNIEDTILITDKGIKLFTNAPHSLFY